LQLNFHYCSIQSPNECKLANQQETRGVFFPSAGDFFSARVARNIDAAPARSSKLKVLGLKSVLLIAAQFGQPGKLQRSICFCEVGDQFVSESTH
jgi:hypothetical protein